MSEPNLSSGISLIWDEPDQRQNSGGGGDGPQVRSDLHRFQSYNSPIPLPYVYMIYIYMYYNIDMYLVLWTESCVHYIKKTFLTEDTFFLFPAASASWRWKKSLSSNAASLKNFTVCFQHMLHPLNNDFFLNKADERQLHLFNNHGMGSTKYLPCWKKHNIY